MPARRTLKPRVNAFLRRGAALPAAASRHHVGADRIVWLHVLPAMRRVHETGVAVGEQRGTMLVASSLLER